MSSVRSVMQGYAEPIRTTGRVRTRRRVRDGHGAPQQPRHLAAQLQAQAFVLDDCRAGDAVAPIDHIAVASSGVWVIASRRVLVERVTLRRSLIATPKLLVGSTDQTDLLTVLDRQRSAICALLADHPQVPIHTAACFVGGQFPFLGSLATGGHVIVPPRDLIASVGAAGPLRRSDSRAIAELLDARLA